MMRPEVISDFSGGFTDYYISASLNKCKRNDNFLLEKHDGVGKIVTRPGSALLDVAHAQLPTGVQRVGRLDVLDGDIFAFSGRAAYCYSAGWNEVLGPYGAGIGKVFQTGVTVNNVTSISRWGHHLFVTSDYYTQPSKIFNAAGHGYCVVTAGLPDLATAPTVAGTGARAYEYAFCYEYTYQIGSTVFEDIGPVTRVSITNGSATTSVTAIPVLSNATDATNYDIVPLFGLTFKVGIYRTTDGGTAFYKVGTVSNGTTTFSDTTTDAALVNNEPLYTEGGVVENDLPPKCAIVHVVGTLAYWANGYEGTDLRKNRIWQSIPGELNAVPGDFFVDIDDDCIGFSSTKDVPVACGSDSAWRIDGKIDELGRGEMVAVRISDTCSCVSGASVVQTLDGIFWAGKDGLYYSDGFNVLRVNENWDKTYALFVATAAQKRRIVGAYDPIHRRVYWTAQSADGTDCDTLFVLHLLFGISTEMPFTTLSSGGIETVQGADNFSPTALAFQEGNLLRGTLQGHIFLHDDTLTSDYIVDTGVAASTWLNTAIIYDYISAGIDFGDPALRKHGTWWSFTADNKSNLSLQPISINDDGRVVANLKPVRFRGNIVWGDPTITWGDPDVVWNKEGSIEGKRRFPKGSLRFTTKQIELTNAYVVIDNSDLLGTVTVNALTKTAVLDDGAATFPSIYAGYYIAFEADLTTDYKIVSVTSSTVTYSDVGNTSGSAALQKFEIKGYPKDEVLNLLTFTVWGDDFSPTQPRFTPGQLNEVSS